MEEITQEKVNIHSKYFAHIILLHAEFCENQAHILWASAVKRGFPASNGAGWSTQNAAEHLRELAKFFSSLPDREAIDKFFDSWDYGPYQQVENDIVDKLKWRWDEAKRLGNF